MLQEGAYEVTVVAATGPKQYEAQAGFDFISRIKSAAPVVSATQNPLVALYSAPPCSAGVVTVSFWPAAGGTHHTTPGQACQPGLSLNFYVAAMQPHTQYTLQQQTVNGSQTTLGPALSFKTGAVNNAMPAYSVIAPSNSQTSTADDIMLMSFKALQNNPPFYPPAAFDLQGNVLWYYWDPESPKTPEDGYLLRPVAGGTLLLFEGSNNALREVDLAGNIVRETNKQPINTQLTALGQDTVVCLSHEALRLPSGHTVTIGSRARGCGGEHGDRSRPEFPGRLDLERLRFHEHQPPGRIGREIHRPVPSYPGIHSQRLDPRELAAADCRRKPADILARPGLDSKTELSKRHWEWRHRLDPGQRGRL
jgi:hypothetical protein